MQRTFRRNRKAKLKKEADSKGITVEQLLENRKKARSSAFSKLRRAANRGKVQNRAAVTPPPAPARVPMTAPANKTINSTVEDGAATSSFTPVSKLTYVGQNKTPEGLQETPVILSGDQSSKEVPKPMAAHIKPGLIKRGNSDEKSSLQKTQMIQFEKRQKAVGRIQKWIKRKLL